MREKYGRTFLRIGLAGFAVLLLAFGLTAYSTVSGVHCLHCDALHLSPGELAFWERYFVAKDGAYGASVVLLAIASPFAAPRRWPFIFGLALAIFALGSTPI